MQKMTSTRSSLTFFDSSRNSCRGTHTGATQEQQQRRAQVRAPQASPVLNDEEPIISMPLTSSVSLPRSQRISFANMMIGRRSCRTTQVGVSL